MLMPAVLPQATLLQSLPARASIGRSLSKRARIKTDYSHTRMLAESYKDYLRFLEKSPRLQIFQKVLVIIIGLMLIAGGGSTALFYWRYQKEQPIRLENSYLEIAGSGFFSAQQSVNDLLAGFQVAGTKTDIVNDLKEASASSSGFFVLTDQLDRTIASIESAGENVSFQKNQLRQTQTPSRFTDLNNRLLSFYDKSIGVFDSLKSRHQFAKEFLLSAGPNFYLQVLSDEALWQTGKNEEIIAYFENIKTEANDSLRKLSELEPPEDFKGQFQTQVSYMELLVKMADNIISILSQQEDLNVENATQLEKAYQVLIGARRENEIFREELISARSELFSPEGNLLQFGPLRIDENTLTSDLENINIQRKQVKTYKLPVFLQKLTTH